VLTPVNAISILLIKVNLGIHLPLRQVTSTHQDPWMYQTLLQTIKIQPGLSP
jgi:hypothetical protein